MPTSPNISGFWRWFADTQSEILEITKGQRQGRVTDLIDAALGANGIELSYDLTEGPEGGELTFTPQGDPSAALFVDRFVAAAPDLSGWVIHNRRQRKSLQAALAFVQAIHGVDISDCHFRVRYLDDRYHLCFLHDGLMALSEEERFGAAATFLDHALGEEMAVQFIGQIEFRPSGPGIEMGLVVNEIIGEIGPESADLSA